MWNRRIEGLLFVTVLMAVPCSAARAQCCPWNDPYADLSEQERSGIFRHEVTLAGVAVAALEDSLATPPENQATGNSTRINDLAKSAFLSWFDVFNGFRRRPPEEFARLDDWEGALLAATQALNDAGFSVVAENDREAAARLLTEFREILASMCKEVERPSLSAAIVRARQIVALVRAAAEQAPPEELPTRAKLVQIAADGLRDAPVWAAPPGVQMPKEQAEKLMAAFPQRRSQQVALLEAAAAALTAKEREKALQSLATCDRDLQAFASAYGRSLF